jgi:hypothetical protein
VRSIAFDLTPRGAPACRKKEDIKKYNHMFGNKLYHVKPLVDTSEPKHMRRFADEARFSASAGSGGGGGGGGGGGATTTNKKKKKKLLSAEGVDMTDSPFAPGRPFTGEVIIRRGPGGAYTPGGAW